MASYFKPNSLQTGQTVMVEIKKFWGPKEGEFGEQFEYDIFVDGQSFKWYATAAAHANIQKCGNSFRLKKIKDKIMDYIPEGGGGFSPEEASFIDAKLFPEKRQAAPAKKEEPDWDAIARGKIRHGVSVAFIERGEPLNDVTKENINAWTDFIFNG